MENYPVPPEYCFIARAFSNARSLREASAALSCDPATLVRKLKVASAEHGLMTKLNGRWVPTERGMRAARWAEASILAQKESLDAKPRLRIAATMWMTEQILVPSIPRIGALTGHRFLWSLQNPSGHFENELLGGNVDFVVACHAPYDPAVAHARVAPERWVAVAPPDWARRAPKSRGAALAAYLQGQPYVRHAELNPDAIVGLGADLLVSDLLVDSLIGVRTAVETGLGWSCVPEILVRRSLAEGRLIALDLPIRLRSDVCLWWLRGRKESQALTRTLVDWLEEALSRRWPT